MTRIPCILFELFTLVAGDFVRRESDQREDGLRGAAFPPDEFNRLKYTSNRLVRAVAIASTGLLLVIAPVPSACASVLHQGIKGDPVSQAAWTELSGSRSTGDNGLTGNGTYFGNGFEIEWHITDNPDGPYHYQYTFSGDALTAPQGGISHFTLDVSDDAIVGDTLADGVIIDPKLGSTMISPGNIEAGNRDFIMGAVKFDLGGDADSLIYEFDSNRSPVWGSFLVKGGGGALPNALTTTSDSGTAYVANNGLFELNDGEGHLNLGLGSTQNWIAVPNGAQAPEPATLVIWCLFAIFGIALSWWRRR